MKMKEPKYFYQLLIVIKYLNNLSTASPRAHYFKNNLIIFPHSWHPPPPNVCTWWRPLIWSHQWYYTRFLWIKPEKECEEGDVRWWLCPTVWDVHIYLGWVFLVLMYLHLWERTRQLQNCLRVRLGYSNDELGGFNLVIALKFSILPIHRTVIYRVKAHSDEITMILEIFCVSPQYSLFSQKWWHFSVN